MFRGIIEGTGEVLRRGPQGLGERLVVALPEAAQPLVLGQSVAINGACLTVVESSGAATSFDLAGETLRRTNLGDLAPGAIVNWERAMRLDDRLDGHLVQGHVDGVGTVASFGERHGDWWLEVLAPRELLATMVPKGCVALDGISLTLADLAADRFACTIVPHTRAVTNLSRRRAGERVNLECDVLIKWLARLQQQSRAG